MSLLKKSSTSSDYLQHMVTEVSRWADDCDALFASNSPLKPSGLWADHVQKLKGWLTTSSNPAEVFRQQLDNNGFTYPRKNDDPEFDKVCASYVTWLEKQGCPLESFPRELQESWMTSDHLCTTIGKRKISVMFLWHLCTLVRLQNLMPTEPKTILEIGGGYGGLARLAKHHWPHCRYMILDLPVSLVYSYLYVVQHFPEAKVLWVTKPKQLRDVNNAEYDFVFIPCSLEEAMYDTIECDLLINTASLGEMAQETADWYVHFIENHLDLRYFFFLNRYGHFTDKRVDHMSHNSCVHFDARWKMHTLDIESERTINRLDHYFPRHMEFFAERLPKEAVSPEMNRMIAEQLLNEAQQHSEHDDRFDLLAYESARIFPTKANTKLYLDYLKEKDFYEYERFSQHFGRADK